MTTDPTTDLGLIRLLVGDSVEGAGARPDGANYSDAEITALRGDAGVFGGAAAVADALAAEWTRRVSAAAGPLRKEWGQAATGFRALAAALRARATAAGETATGLGTLQAGTLQGGEWTDYTDLRNV